MNLGHETETLEFKKTTGELKEGVVSIAVTLYDFLYAEGGENPHD